MQNKEIELKFGFDGDARNLHQVFANIGRVSGETTLHLDNTYFDTDKRDFFSFKAGLRIRIADNYSEQTLKVKGEAAGGLHKRSEYNIPVERNTKVPDLSLFPQEAFPAGFDTESVQKELKPVCNISFERKLFNFEILDSVFEVAYDHGIIKVADASYPLNELEIELKESSVKSDELLNLFSILCSKLAENDIPLLLEPFSKMHRATLLQERSKNVVDVTELSNADDLVSHISKQISLFEQMYGLYLISLEANLLSFVLTQLKELICSLKALKRRNYYAFLPMQREPVEYMDDLKVIIRLLKSFYRRCNVVYKRMSRARLKENIDRYEELSLEIRKAELHSKIFLIPLKLRQLISLINK